MARGRRKWNPLISKRLQTELQSLIAFGCYDSNSVLKCGKSAKKNTLVTKVHQLYIPSNNSDSDHVSQIELFLEGRGKYKHLFERKCIDPGPSTKNTSNSNCSSSESNEVSGEKPSLLMIPEMLHCLPDTEISVKNDCIDKTLLTRRNLTNFVDIQPSTLFRHAKEVEANCKKALAICLAEDSPYRSYDGIFPSGTNREDYLFWLRKKMYLATNNTTLEDLVDDNDEDPDSAETEEADNNSVDVEAADVMDELPPEEYFKGYFAFALWGYIPPNGGDFFKVH